MEVLSAVHIIYVLATTPPQWMNFNKKKRICYSGRINFDMQFLFRQQRLAKFEKE